MEFQSVIAWSEVLSMTSTGKHLKCTQLLLPGLPAYLNHNKTEIPHENQEKKRKISTIDLHKLRPFGNSHLLNGVTLCGEAEIPQIAPESAIPDHLVAWSEAKSIKDKSNSWLHFFEDDYRFQEIWRDPEILFSTAREFAGIISPDFSLYLDMPTPIKITNTYKNHLLGRAAQIRGIQTITNVRLSGVNSAWYALAGAPRNSIIALGLHGTIKNRENRKIVLKEIEIITNTLEPTGIVVYGSAAYGVLDYPAGLDIPIYLFPADTYKRSHYRRVA